MGLLNHANRQTGNWLPEVESCPERVQPCGNPRCTDQAMRASELGPGIVNDIIAKESTQHAVEIANRCQKNGTPCPLEKATGNRFSAINFLSRRG